MARHAAKTIVAAGLAREVEIQVAYAIGRAAPLAVNVDTRGTGSISNEQIQRAVLSVFDFRPGAIIDKFQLQRPIYESLSAYGHFGRTDIDTPWEMVDRIEDLKRAVS